MRLRDQSSSMLESRNWPAKKPTKEPKFTCKVCSERFNKRAKSNRHQRDAHSDDPAEPKPFVCGQFGSAC